MVIQDRQGIQRTRMFVTGNGTSENGRKGQEWAWEKPTIKDRQGFLTIRLLPEQRGTLQLIVADVH